MAECSQHQDILRKTLQNCTDIAAIKERISACESAVEQIDATIFGAGGPDSLKSRIKGAEDAVSGLEAKVLENRSIVKEQLRGMRNLIATLITVAIVVIGGMFGLLWQEIQEIETLTEMSK